MKRLTIILFTILLPISAMAQESQMSQLMKRYSKERGFTTMELSRQMLDSMGVGDGIDSMRAISTESDTLLQKFCKEVEILVAELNCVMSVVSDGKDVKIYSRTASNGRVISVVIFIHSTSSATLIWLTGNNIELSKALSKIEIAK